MVLSLGGNTSHHLILKGIITKLQLNVGRAESLQQQLYRYKSGLVTHYTNVNTGKKYNSESCMVHHIHVIMQIKTLSRLQKYQKRFSKNCLIDSNSQTMELKNFVAIMVKSFLSSKIWCVIISINLNDKNDSFWIFRITE